MALAPNLEARIRADLGLYILGQVRGLDTDGQITPAGRIFNVPFIRDVMVRALHSLALHEIEALMFLLPPRHGKSFVGTVCFVPWYMGRYPDLNSMVISYNDNVAFDFGREILKRIKSPFHKAVFPDFGLLGKYQGQTFFETTRGGKFWSAGFGGTITSKGISGILVTDDPIQNMEVAKSDQQMRTLIETRKSTVRMRFEGASELLCATRWSRNDYVARLLDEEGEVHEGGRWTVVKIPAEAGENDPMQRAPGEFLWPEARGRSWYIENKKHSKTWMALCQQDPQGNYGLMFKREWLQFYTTPVKPGRWPTYMVCDPAKGQEADKDRTCILVFMATQEKRLVLVDASLGRYTPDERAKEVIRLCKKWKPIRFLYEEYGMNNDSYYLNIEMAKAKLRIHPIAVGRKGRANQSKETRIEGLIPDFREGRIWLPAKKIGDEIVPRMGVNVDMAGGAMWVGQKRVQVEESEFIDIIDYFIEHEYGVYAGEDSVEHDDLLDAMSRIHEPELNISFPLAPQALASQMDAIRNRAVQPGSWESRY